MCANSQEPLSILLSLPTEVCQHGEEEFFKDTRDNLQQICEFVCTQCCASSVAAFFVTEEPRNGPQAMVMRGAAGSLVRTLNENVDDWIAAREKGECKALRGFSYTSLVTSEFRKLTAERQREVIQQWPVTNQIWHLASGRIANSNRAMDGLHQGFSSNARAIRTGLGDRFAYPGQNLSTTFRNMIAVPIFAEGGGTEIFSVDEIEETGIAYPGSASDRRGFLSRYRVIGILKAEGRKPLTSTPRAGKSLWAELESTLASLSLSEENKEEIRQWCEHVSSFDDSEQQLHIEFPPFMQGDREAPRIVEIRKAMADGYSKCYGAEFTRQDTELLLLLGMQLGRLLTHRTIKYAASEGIIIGENEVGILNVRWQDIQELSALFHAADIMERKIATHLQGLKRLLDFEQRQRVHRTRITELLDPQGLIREIGTRRKTSPSLIRKLVRKERELDDNSEVQIVHAADLKARFVGYGHLSSGSFVGRGLARVFLAKENGGSARTVFQGECGTRGAPRLRFQEGMTMAAVERVRRERVCRGPLVRRILDPKCYNIDDLCGARVTTDYDSAIDELLDEFRLRSKEWGFQLEKVDDLREAGRDGYRAVHVTLSLNMEPYLPKRVATLLRTALAPLPLSLPCEIQLRTAYQDSWAKKTHAESYKRESFISDEARDEWEILSNVLGQADRLSDIVRSKTEEDLLPPDFGEARLLRYLRRRLSRDDLTVVLFGIDCAKELLKDRLRYNGLPEFSFAMEICERLVYHFQVLDPTMLLLSMLRHTWRKASGDPSLGREFGRPAGSDTIVGLLSKELHEHCEVVLRKYRNRVPLEESKRQRTDWLASWLKQLPPWFWAMQWSARSYFLQRREDRLAQWQTRLREVYDHLVQHYAERGHDGLDESLERAYIVEAAVLLASLAELPHEPGRNRRIRLLREYRELFREICRYLPNRPTKQRVIEDLARALREVEL